ncbi:hypothetical protein P8C59_004218 [Phyllachora maydis]|uniref:Uncharacterized protein n=1 Tax=Phyllachora maydis TaxID=1825666 RepID=A0AAD9ME58_9PEZI|nr:hypothetical protein P8C59_004218 [Phyllachora maydis]
MGISSSSSRSTRSRRHYYKFSTPQRDQSGDYYPPAANRRYGRGRPHRHRGTRTLFARPTGDTAKRPRQWAMLLAEKTRKCQLAFINRKPEDFVKRAKDQKVPLGTDTYRLPPNPK